MGGLLRAALSLRFTATGSRPSPMVVALMIVALVQACLRASASETDGYDPRLKFFLLPWMVKRLRFLVVMAPYIIMAVYQFIYHLLVDGTGLRGI